MRLNIIFCMGACPPVSLAGLSAS